MTQENEHSVDALYERAKQENNRLNREAHVVEILKRYLRVRPQHAHAWFLYGDALRVLGRWKESLTALQNALELLPNDKRYPIRARIGMLFADRADRDEAERWFAQAIETGARSLGWVWVLRGANLVSQGKFDKALECYQSATQATEELQLDEVYLNIGKVFRATEKYSEAIEAFEKALQIDPNNDDVRSELEGLKDISSTIVDMKAWDG